nr:hypothetical protein BaRGS_033637 [Batillaria attramentaria]
MQTLAQTGHIVFHVQEELPSGTLVGNVADASNIQDEVEPDLVDNLQFQILSSDGLRITSMFSINGRSGAIFTNAMIDREQVCDLAPVCELEFDVTVKSGVNFVKLLTVKVIIDDINDNAPSFPTGRSVSQYSLEGSSVFSLKEVRQLDGTSALKLIVQQDLDREAVSSYSFLILASDGDNQDFPHRWELFVGSLKVEDRTMGLEGEVTCSSLEPHFSLQSLENNVASFTVMVRDVNDNAPEFTKPVYTATVTENLPEALSVVRVTATDRDDRTDSNNQDQYIVIAGVIAGVTFVISVVVIAIIIHMRNSDLRRRGAERNKTFPWTSCNLDNAKNIKVCNTLVATETGKKNQGTVSVDGVHCRVIEGLEK